MIRPVTVGMYLIICDTEACEETILIRADNGWLAYQKLVGVKWGITDVDLCRDCDKKMVRTSNRRNSKKSGGRVGVS